LLLSLMFHLLLLSLMFHLLLLSLMFHLLLAALLLLVTPFLLAFRLISYMLPLCW
jgi:hypothetical protein